MSDKRLAANLIEISCAKSSKDLVAWGNRIYHSGYGRGRIIKWLQGLPWLRAHRDEHVNKALIKTRDLFYHKIGQLEKTNRYLKRGYKRILIGKEIKDPHFLRAKAKLLSFSSYLEPIMKATRKEQPTKALSFLLSDIKNQTEKQEAAAAIKDLFEELHLYQKMFNFEEATKTEIPLYLLQKMSFDDRLNIKEEKAVVRWINQLQQSSQNNIPAFEGGLKNCYVKTRSMHRMLCKIVEFINHNLPKREQDFDSAIETLETNLVVLGYRIFDQDDTKHIAWANTLDVGQELEWDGRKIFLEKIIHNPERNKGEPVIFSVENEPDIEVVAHLKSEATTYQQIFHKRILHCGLPGKEILGISEFGKIIVQERLHETLADIKWESNRDTGLTKKDRKSAKPIVELLKGFKSMPFTPMAGENLGGSIIGMLLPKYFGFNGQNQLKSAVCLTPGHFSFDVLEMFAWECSQRNLVVFNYIMRASGLSRIQEAKEYQELFEDALNEKDAFRAVTRNTSITDEELKRKRSSIYLETRYHFEECLKFNHARYKLNGKTFRKQMIQELTALQKLICPGSILSLQLFSYALRNIYIQIRPEMKQRAYKEKLAEIIAAKDPAYLDKKNNMPFYNQGIYSGKQIRNARKQAAKAMKSV